MEKKSELNFDQFRQMLVNECLNGAEEVYAHFIKGAPLSKKRFAELLKVDVQEADKVLASYGEVDSHNQVVGFLGLSLIPTQHKITVKDNTFYTWCAADTILFPQFLSFSALIESKDPISNKLIQLSVNEDFLKWTNPTPLYISWVEKVDSSKIRQSFCSNSHFFESQETVNKWLSLNPDTRFSKVDDFITLSKEEKSCC